MRFQLCSPQFSLDLFAAFILFSVSLEPIKFEFKTHSAFLMTIKKLLLRFDPASDSLFYFYENVFRERERCSKFPSNQKLISKAYDFLFYFSDGPFFY